MSLMTDSLSTSSLLCMVWKEEVAVVMEGRDPSGKLLLTVPNTFSFIESLKEGSVLVVAVDMEGDDTDTPLLTPPPRGPGPLRDTGPLIDVCTPPEPPPKLMFLTPWPPWDVSGGWLDTWPWEARFCWPHIMEECVLGERICIVLEPGEGRSGACDKVVLICHTGP